MDRRRPMFRDIISPNKELLFFLDLIKEVEMDPALIEYTDGKFVARNFNKYHLCRMFFHNGVGKKMGDKIETMMVVDFNKYEGKKLDKLKTIWGDNFIDFHHKILKEAVPAIDMKKICDFSKWFNKHRKKSQYYYLHYLALFIAHGVLFENFILSKGEKEFTLKKIIPSFRKAEQIFGIKPIIVPLTLVEDENELYWWCYPGKIKSMVEKQLKIGLNNEN